MPVFKMVTTAGLAKKVKEAFGKYGTNGTLHALPKFCACSWASTGMLQKSSALLDTTATFAGVAADIIPSNTVGLVYHSGNVPGALVGLNATPGQPVFLSEAAGELTLVAPPITSGIIRVGFAQPADGILDGSANDLLVEIEFILQP